MKKEPIENPKKQQIEEYLAEIMEKQPPIYLFDSRISYKSFYAVWSKFPAGSIVPIHFLNGKIIWQLINAKKLFVYLDPLCKDDPICFGMKLPKNRKIKLITNPKRK